MKVNVNYPFDRLKHAEEFLTVEAIRECAQTIERCGFTAGYDTDHPVPTGRWLDHGGHIAQDPFVILTYVAAFTTKLKLQTGILVLPYRNPFITARAVATLDHLSGGRVVLGVGAGYLKGEYKALGVDFDRRNELMDEYLRAMRAAWSSDEFEFQGSGYQALGNRILPRPAQRPHPPLLIGGSSKRAIRRAVELGDAWNPFFNNPVVAATTRTAVFDDAALLEGIGYLKAHCEQIGRETPPEIILSAISQPGDEWNPAALLDRIGRYRELGITGVGAHIDATTRAEWCDKAERWGAEVIARLD